MKSIDFLPERYVERDLKRKAAIWQYALLLSFGGLMLAATIGQFAIKRSLRANLTELTQSRIDTTLRRGEVELLKKKLGKDKELAALYTYLRHPWPRTQLLARITELLPNSVVLEGVEILEQQPTHSAFAATEKRDEVSGATPAAADLAKLRGDHDATQLVVRIRGTVDDTAALNGYVRQLDNEVLFSSASLSSLQAKNSRDEMPRSAFELNLTVRPGHGQAGGPDQPLLTRHQTAQYPPGRQSR